MNQILGFERSSFCHENASREVFRAGCGPAVIVISEVPGITPLVASFARRVAEAGFSVYMPHLFGTPMKPFSYGYAAGVVAKICISREFRLLAANESSPVLDWLRALARQAHAECGGRGVGAVGMCLTGNFALGMMLDAPVLAPVLSQPSLPIPLTPSLRSALHASPRAIAAAHEKIERHGARILGLRFHGDPYCPAERFRRLRLEFGEAFESIELSPEDANPQGPWPAHSVLTNHLIDEAGQPTRMALERTIRFLTEQLRAEQSRDDPPRPAPRAR